MSQALPTPAADSVSAALDRVFSAPKYDWEASRDPFRFLSELLYDLAVWMEGLRQSHPAVWVVLLGLLYILVDVVRFPLPESSPASARSSSV